MGRVVGWMACFLAVFQAGFVSEPLKTEEQYLFEGIHYLASYKECNKARLCDCEEVCQVLLRAVEASGACVLDYSSYVFPPNGFTMVVLLSESHASIHTYPEWGACFVDLFTCGTHCSYQDFEKVLEEYLEPGRFESRIMTRD